MLKKFFTKFDAESLGIIAKASTIGLHLVSGVFVGAGIGYLLDHVFESTPWCFFIFIFLGIAAGFNNVVIDAKRLIASQEQQNAQSASQKN